MLIAAIMNHDNQLVLRVISFWIDFSFKSTYLKLPTALHYCISCARPHFVKCLPRFYLKLTTALTKCWLKCNISIMAHLKWPMSFLQRPKQSSGILKASWILFRGKKFKNCAKDLSSMEWIYSFHFTLDIFVFFQMKNVVSRGHPIPSIINSVVPKIW